MTSFPSWDCASAAAVEWPPQDHEISRYEHIWKTSPFVAAAEVTPQAESIVQRYVITAFGRIGDNDVVFLFDRKGLSRFPVTKANPVNGVELLSVDPEADIKQIGAKIRMDGEVASISYDPNIGGAGQSDTKGDTGNSQKPAKPGPQGSSAVPTPSTGQPSQPKPPASSTAWAMSGPSSSREAAHGASSPMILSGTDSKAAATGQPAQTDAPVGGIIIRRQQIRLE